MRSSPTWVQAEATGYMNVFISVLYAEGFWVRRQKGQVLGRFLRAFLLLYQRCSAEALKLGLNRFPMMPKGHMLSHTAYDMLNPPDEAAWIANPLSSSNQMQEDYIGRPCRLSRRVHGSKLHRRVLDRSLLASFFALFE